MAERYTRLIGIGLCRTVPLTEIRVGDRLMWNYGSICQVEAIEQQSKYFVVLTERYERDGTVYQRRMKITRHVVRVPAKVK